MIIKTKKKNNLIKNFIKWVINCKYKSKLKNFNNSLRQMNVNCF